MVGAAYSLNFILTSIGEVGERLKQLMASAISARVFDCGNELVEEVTVGWGEYDLDRIAISMYELCCRKSYSSSYLLNRVLELAVRFDYRRHCLK